MQDRVRCIRLVSKIYSVPVPVTARDLESAFRAFTWSTCVSQYERFVINLNSVEYVARAIECYDAGEDDTEAFSGMAGPFQTTT